MTVHLVNLTNPMMMRGPFRELMPVGPERLRLRLPDGAKVKRVHLLKARTEASYEVTDGVLRTMVPQVADQEVVAVDLVG